MPLALENLDTIFIIVIDNLYLYFTSIIAREHEQPWTIESLRTQDCQRKKLNVRCQIRNCKNIIYWGLFEITKMLFTGREYME